MSEANLPLDAVALGCFDNPRVVLPEELLAVTVVQPLERIGRKAVQVIIDNLNGTETRSRELIGPEIVVSKAVTSETKELAPVV